MKNFKEIGSIFLKFNLTIDINLEEVRRNSTYVTTFINGERVYVANGTGNKIYIVCDDEIFIATELTLEEFCILITFFKK